MVPREMLASFVVLQVDMLALTATMAIVLPSATGPCRGRPFLYKENKAITLYMKVSNQVFSISIRLGLKEKIDSKTPLC